VKQTGMDGTYSWVQAALQEGESYTFEKFGKNTVTVEVTKIDTSIEASGYAYVLVYEGEKEDGGSEMSCLGNEDCSFLCDSGTCQEGSCNFDQSCSFTSSVSVSTNKGTYTPGEGIEVSYANNSPKTEDWVWILPSTVPVNEFGKIPEEEWDNDESSWHDLWGYTDGTEGQLEFDSTNLEPGSYKVLYLWIDGFEMAATSSTFTVVQAGQTLPPTQAPQPEDPSGVEISVNGSIFEGATDMEVSFQVSHPTHYDWIAIYPADQPVDEDGRLDDDYIEDWIYYCGSEDSDDCDEVLITGGIVTFNSENVSKEGLYKAYYLCCDDYSVQAESEPFTVIPPPQIVEVSLAKALVAPGESIEVTFSNTEPHYDDWLAIVSADDGEVIDSEDRLINDMDDVLDWVFVCGSKTSSECTEEDGAAGSHTFAGRAAGNYKGESDPCQQSLP